MVGIKKISVEKLNISLDIFFRNQKDPKKIAPTSIEENFYFWKLDNPFLNFESKGKDMYPSFKKIGNFLIIYRRNLLQTNYVHKLPKNDDGIPYLRTPIPLEFTKT